MLKLNLLETDTRFEDSPDAGWPECICSRCGEMIKEDEVPIRAWDNDCNFEYRFCEKCIPEVLS